MATFVSGQNSIVNDSRSKFLAGQSKGQTVTGSLNRPSVGSEQYAKVVDVHGNDITPTVYNSSNIPQDSNTLSNEKAIDFNSPDKSSPTDMSGRDQLSNRYTDTKGKSYTPFDTTAVSGGLNRPAVGNETYTKVVDVYGNNITPVKTSSSVNNFDKFIPEGFRKENYINNPKPITSFSGGGLIPVSSDFDSSTTLPVWKVISPNNQLGWLSAIDEGAFASSNVKLYKSPLGSFSGQLPEGVYEYNTANINMARDIFKDISNFKDNPESFINKKGVLGTSSPTGISYQMTPDYFKNNYSDYNAYLKNSKDSFSNLSSDVKFQSRVNEFVTGNLKAGVELNYATGNFMVAGLGGLKREGESWDLLKAKPIFEYTGFSKDLIETPSALGVVTPYNTFKYSTLSLGLVGASIGTYSNVKNFGYVKGFKETIASANPFQINREYTPDLDKSLLDTKGYPFKTTEVISGKTSIQKTTAQLGDEDWGFKINSFQKTTSDEGLTSGSSFTTIQYPKVTYYGGELTTTNELKGVYNYFESTPKGLGMVNKIGSITSDGISFTETFSVRQNFPVNKNVYVGRYAGGERSLGFYNYGEKGVYNFEQEFSPKVRGTLIGINLGEGESSSGGFKFISSGKGSSDSSTGTLKGFNSPTNLGLSNINIASSTSYGTFKNIFPSFSSLTSQTKTSQASKTKQVPIMSFSSVTKQISVNLNKVIPNQDSGTITKTKTVSLTKIIPSFGSGSGQSQGSSQAQKTNLITIPSSYFPPEPSISVGKIINNIPPTIPSFDFPTPSFDFGNLPTRKYKGKQRFKKTPSYYKIVTNRVSPKFHWSFNKVNLPKFKF